MVPVGSIDVCFVVVKGVLSGVLGTVTFGENACVLSSVVTGVLSGVVSGLWLTLGLESSDGWADVSLDADDVPEDATGTVAPVPSGIDVEIVEPSDGAVCDS